ncbi:MAG: PAS domain-containing sensor histidine kinase [Actinobacteria bacterium]|nr:PAS domain-containing sensor histidine kinase [Actinomycetota bacterium]
MKEAGASPGFKRINGLQKVLLAVNGAGALILTGLSLIYLALGYQNVRQTVLSILIYTVIMVLLASLSVLFVSRYSRRILRSESDIISISDISSSAVFAIDRNLAITAWSKGSQSLFGYNAEEVTGQKLNIILSDESAGVHFDELARLSGEESDITNNLSFRKKDGCAFHARASLSVTENGDGENKAIVAIVQSISSDIEELQIKEMLQESEKRLRSLFESSTDGILRLKANGDILDCNSAICEMLVYTPEELKELTYADITPMEWHAIDRDILGNQLHETGRTDMYTKQLRCKDGVTIPVSTVAWRVNENPPSSWVIVKDLSGQLENEKFVRETIAHLEHANERLQKLDRDKTEFVVMVSHELQAPLATIASSIEALKLLRGNGYGGDEKKLEEVLIRGVKRLSGLVDELLDITRIESGQLKLHIEPSDADKIISSVVSSFQNRFSEKGLFIKSKNSGGACIIDCDAGRIEQVLANLVGNSLKFTDQGGVVVELRSERDSARISVSDTGSGIPPERMDKIFEKFYTSDVSRKGTRQGMGLGLAISRGIIEAHGGTLTAENNNSAGVRFSIVIPWDAEVKAKRV